MVSKIDMHDKPNFGFLLFPNFTSPLHRIKIPANILLKTKLFRPKTATP